MATSSGLKGRPASETASDPPKEKDGAAPLPPLTIVSGHSGAGKTTLLNYLLREAKGLHALLITDDLRNVEIDPALAPRREGDTIHLLNGSTCILVADIEVAIRTAIASAHRTDAMIVETHDAAESEKIARQAAIHNLHIDGVIAVADAEKIWQQAAHERPTGVLLPSFAQADLILLNKIDCVSPQQLAAARNWLLQHAPGVAIYETFHADAPLAILLGKATEVSPGIHESRWFSGNSLVNRLQCRTWTVTHDKPLTRTTFDRFASMLGQYIFRAKGILYLANEPERRFLYEHVGRRWKIEISKRWGDYSTRKTLIVCVGPPHSRLAKSRVAR